MADIGLYDASAVRLRPVVEVEDSAAEERRPRPIRRPRRRAGMDLVSGILFMMVWSLVVFTVARYAELDHLLIKAAVPLGILFSIPLLALLMLSCYEWFYISREEEESDE